MMNILYISGIPSPYRVDFFNELSRFCNLTVIYEKKESDERDEAWKLGKHGEYNSIFLTGIHTDVDKALSFSVISYLKKLKYDLVVMHGYISPTAMIAIEYMKMKKIKFCIEVDGGLIKQDSLIVGLVKRHFMSGADFWLSTGEHCSKYLKHYGATETNIYKYPFTSIRRNKILPSIMGKEQKDIVRKSIGIKESKIILTVGQFIPRKGIDVLIAAAAELKGDIGIYIIGGKPTELYKQEAQKVKSARIYFMGFMSGEMLGEYYKAADVFVLPTREDVWGLVVNEAMAYGLPVITTNKCIAGLELIEPGVNGYLYSVESVRELTDCIQKSILNESDRVQMGNRNIEKIKKYTIENMAKRHMEIFLNGCKNSKSDSVLGICL